jgi:hypothetical protein
MNDILSKSTPVGRDSVEPLQGKATRRLPPFARTRTPFLILQRFQWNGKPDRQLICWLLMMSQPPGVSDFV